MVNGLTVYSRDSDSCRVGGDTDPGWTARLCAKGGRRGHWCDESLRSPRVFALPAGNGHELSPRLSRSLGTSSPSGSSVQGDSGG